jgi:MFS family permease
VSAALAAPPLSAREQTTVFVVAIGHGVAHWMHGVVFILLPVVREEFGLDYTDIGVFGLVYYSAATAVNLLGGPVTDMVRRRERFQILSLVLLSLSLLAIGLSSSFALFCAASALVAIGNSLWHPAAIPYLASRFERRRGYVLSIHSMFSNLGDSIAPAVVGAMITGWFVVQIDWRQAAMLNVFPALLVLPLLWVFVLRDDPDVTQAQSSARMDLAGYWCGLLEQLKSKTVLGLALMAGLRSTAQGGIRVFLPLYVTDVLGLPLAVAGFALTALAIGGAITAVPAGMASDRFGRRPVVMIFLLLSSVLIVGVTLLTDEVSFVVGICLVGLSLYALRPVMLSWMMDVVPRELRGTGTNLMFTTQSLFQIANPLIAGALADAFGLVVVFYYFAAMLLLANLVAFLIPRADRQVSAPA